MKILLYNKNFRNLTLIDLFSSIGDVFFYLALINYAETFSNSGFYITLISIFVSIPSIFSFFLGILSDNLSKKINAEIISLFLRFINYLIIAVIIWKINTNTAILVILFIFLFSEGLGIFEDGLRFPVLKTVLPDSNLEQEYAFGFSAALFEMVSLTSKFLGGLLIILLNYNYILFSLLNSLTFLFGAICLIRIKKNLPVKIFNTPKGKSLDIKSIKNLWISITIKKEILFMLIVNSIISILPTLAIIKVSDTPIWGISFTITSTFIILIEGIGVISGSLLSGKILLNFKLENLYVISLLVVVLFSFLGIFYFPIFLIGIFFTNLLLGLVFPKFEVKIINESDINNATIIGMTNTAITIFIPLIIFCFSWILHNFGIDLTLAILSFISIILCLLIKNFSKIKG